MVFVDWGILYLKRSGIYKGDQQKRHIFFYGSSLAITFEFSRISKTKLTSREYLKRYFLNHPACFFWNTPLVDSWNFCSRCWDIYSAHCTGLERFPELTQNKICYILHPTYTFFPCFPTICMSAIWKSLF